MFVIFHESLLKTFQMDASDSFQDSEEEKEKRIDTSWFLTKEEMINYLNDPRRKERKKLNPTEAIYQRGRRHRGFTQVSKGFGSTPSPSPTKSQTGSPTILEESMDSLSKDQSDVDASNDIVSSGRIPDDSLTSTKHCLTFYCFFIKVYEIYIV